MDDDTLASGALVATVSFPPMPDGSFSEIAPAMHGGDSAPIPGEVARYAARFRSGQTRNDLILVVVLWDGQDTPLYAIAKGYDAFLTEIRDAVADNLVALSTADEDQEKTIEEAIKKRVHDKVAAAITGGLSDLDKVAFVTHLKIPDRVIDSQFRHVSLQAAELGHAVHAHVQRRDRRVPARRRAEGGRGSLRGPGGAGPVRSADH